MRCSSLHGGFAPLAIVLFIALSGCDPTVEAVDDEVACAGVRCTAGACFSNGGQPSCRCGPWEESAGLLCQVAVFVVPDDHGGSPEEATPVTVGEGPVESRISASTRGMSDRDLFTFTAKAGHSYVFHCVSVSLPHCQPRLLDAAGRHLGAFTLDAKRSAWLFTGLEEGTWYVEVSGDGGSTGTYTYQLLDLGLDDYGNYPEAASRVSPSEVPFTVTSTFLADDDVVRFQAVEGHGYRFGCELPTLESGVVLRLLEASGRVVDSAEGLGTRRLPQLDLKATTSGPRFVQVSPTYGQTPMTFNCRLTDLGLDDHGDTTATATRLTPGVPVSVRMHSRKDVDELVFTAQLGHHYVLRQQPPVPVDIQLFDAGGRRLGVSVPNGYLYVPGGAGAYHLRLTAPRSGSSDEAFNLVVEDLGPDDYPAYVTDEAPHPLGVPIPVRAHSAVDPDSLDFGVEANGVYAMTCEPECRANIFVTGSWDTSAPALVGSKHFSANGDTSLNITLRPSAVLGGAHTVKLERVGTDDHPSTQAGATRLALPVSIAGNFEAENDLEFFIVPLQAGRAYRVEAPPSVRVSFLGPDGYWEAAMGGRYVARATSNHGLTLRLEEGGFPGTWSLKLTPE
ncbi:hypothetical protein [Pyxidicoccus trucidator]|uniref:hypothetical protein n=1 Tax=Pyxidicoccus trucidator TaxID=2709662 RepID=UPI0013DB4190|nr:hypothetical protein [Pyxidicoccus trucidator]